MFGWTWVHEYGLFQLAEAPRSMVPESLVRLFHSQSEVDRVSETEEDVDYTLPPTRSPSPPWSDDETRAAGVMRSV